MAIAFVRSASVATGASATTQAVAFSGNITSGNLIVVVTAWFSASITVTSVTDTASNTYVAASSVSANSNGSIQIWYAKNIVGGGTAPTVTVNYSASVADRSLVILEYSGANATAPLDQSAIDTYASGGLTPDVGPVTTTDDGELIVAGEWMTNDPGSATVAPGSGYTERVDISGIGSSGFPFEVEDQVQATAGSISADWVMTPPNVSDGIMAMATFLKAPTGVITPTVGAETVAGTSSVLNRGLLTRTALKGT